MGLTAIVGALFILQAWSIFLSGENSPYTAEIIHEKFRQIAIPFWFWVAAVIFGGVLAYRFPEEEKIGKAQADLRKNLYHLKGRLPQNEGGRYALNKENRFRIVVLAVCIALCVLFGIIALLYLLNKNYTPLFSAEIFTENNGAADRLVRGLPWCLAALIVGMIAVELIKRSLKRETAAVKKQIAENAKKGVKPAQAQKKNSVWKTLCLKYPVLTSKWWKIGLQAGLCVLALVLIVVGICNGGMLDVYDKARKICTQCIGLG
jgi:hypothetical protein